MQASVLFFLNLFIFILLTKSSLRGRERPVAIAIQSYLEREYHP